MGSPGFSASAPASCCAFEFTCEHTFKNDIEGNIRFSKVSYCECSVNGIKTVVAPLAVGTFGVTEYRAYTVGPDGHFIGIEPLTCANDAEAIEKARQLVDGHDVELWSGGRLVIRLKYESPQ